MVAPKQTDPQFKLRLTPDLKDRIEAAAAVNNRSMNAEIIDRLEASFVGQSASSILTAAIEEYGRKMDSQIAELKRETDRFKALADAMGTLRDRPWT